MYIVEHRTGSGVTREIREGDLPPPKPVTSMCCTEVKSYYDSIVDGILMSDRTAYKIKKEYIARKNYKKKNPKMCI